MKHVVLEIRFLVPDDRAEGLVATLHNKGVVLAGNLLEISGAEEMPSVTTRKFDVRPITELTPPGSFPRPTPGNSI